MLQWLYHRIKASPTILYGVIIYERMDEQVEGMAKSFKLEEEGAPDIWYHHSWCSLECLCIRE